MSTDFPKLHAFLLTIRDSWLHKFNLSGSPLDIVNICSVYMTYRFAGSVAAIYDG